MCVALGGVADEKLAFRIVVFQPLLEGSTHEAAADDSDVDHNYLYSIILAK